MVWQDHIELNSHNVTSVFIRESMERSHRVASVVDDKTGQYGPSPTRVCNGQGCTFPPVEGFRHCCQMHALGPQKPGTLAPPDVT